MYKTAETVATDAKMREFAPLVRRMARHLHSKLPPSVEIDDIIQAGMIGLMDAASRFDEAQGIQFGAYATQRVRGAMLDELRANDWMPRATRRALRDIERTIQRLEQRLDRAAGEAEIAQELGVPVAEYQALLQDARGHDLVHLEDCGRDGDDDYLDHNCPDRRDDPAAHYEDSRFRAALIGGIENLPPREKLLMGLYYEKELNFKEIAAVLEVSESRVCQLHGQAVERLRAKLKAW